MVIHNCKKKKTFWTFIFTSNSKTILKSQQLHRDSEAALLEQIQMFEDLTQVSRGEKRE